MLFHTPEFMILMFLTLIIYYYFPQKRLYVLACANIIFYGVLGLGYLFLFLAVASLTYYFSLKLTEKYKKVYLWLGIILNLVNLMFFKYSLFILNNLEKILAMDLVLENSIFTSLILPVGISFYTFQMIAYLVDVYQEKINPCKTWLDFWVFISFFAQLVAGPIMRGKKFIPQINRLNKINFNLWYFKLGLAYIALGLFKKIVLADNIAVYADNFFNRGLSLSGQEAWIAAYLFAFQIYFDFSAYSEMALGIGHLFGIKLDTNFKTPYLSTNSTEFWKRWHITLSNWIKDYIYIPLGGSRKGELRQIINLFLAMSISGLWHGAAWTFVIWGMYHGILLIIHKVYIKIKDRYQLNIYTSRLYNYFSIFVFFQLTCLGWVFFRAEGITIALNMLKKMVLVNPFYLNKVLAKYYIIVAVLYILHIMEYLIRKNYQRVNVIWHNYFPAPLRGLAYTVFIVLLVIFLQNEQNSFIYFQF